MVKVRVPMMVDDARFAPLGRPEAIEGYDIVEEWFQDGPTTERVTIVDADLVTKRSYPPARYVPPAPGRVLGRYAIQEPYQVDSRTFNQVSTFATVMKTVRLFEERDTLGRRVSWAFGKPQLTVLPRAGWGENAFYRRERGSLEFHYFFSHHNPSQIIYTSMARDIVAHETGHAILDGIAPRLWEGVTAQSLALHEAVADLTALLVSIRSRVLRSAVLKRTAGSIENSSHFSAIGEEFGMSRGSGALRDLKNDLTLSRVPRDDPHRLSEVLTGALYVVLVKMHAQRTEAEAQRRDVSFYSASGYGLWTAAEHLKRMTLRALDYLPPGEASLANYARAILAADQASHPDDPQEREWLVEELIRREITPDRAALDASVDAERANALLGQTGLNELAASDAAAEAFVGSPLGRAVLHIPENARIVLEPRLVVAKVYYHRSPDGILWPLTVREGLLKVWWREWEAHGLAPVATPPRELVVGTTMSWDWDSGRVRVLLTSARRVEIE